MNEFASLISVILPVFNGEKYLSQSIESCLNQTYHNIELIIVNDCSTDSTLMIANRFAKIDNRVRIINNKENKKLPASLNIGHNEAKGGFITWTSDDNLYELNALEVLLNEIVDKKADIVYSNIILIDHNDNEVREVKLPEIENIIFGNFIGACFLYNRGVFERNNGYDEKLFLVEDYDFWLRAVFHSRFSKINKSLYRYRKHKKSLTNLLATNKDKNQIWKENVNSMYINFCKTVGINSYNEIASFLFKKLTHQNISFDWIVNNDNIIVDFKSKLKQNINFMNGNLIEIVFMKQTIGIMTLEKSYKINFSRSLFIIKKYAKVLDNNAIKILIKYTFFK